MNAHAVNFKYRPADQKIDLGDTDQYGSGIGFSVVKPIVEVRSGIFWIILPSETGAIMKVLVVDEDLILSDVIGFTLRRAGFEVTFAFDGQKAYERWQIDMPDLVILDIKLPVLDGLSLCKRIRAQRSTPVIILSVQGADEDIINGLETGADDYIAKPFSPAQLVARVKAVLRRAGMTPLASNMNCGDLSLDLSRRAVQVLSQEKNVRLTPLECRLLEALILNSGRVLPNETLITHIWGVAGGDRVMLKQLVHRLRQKIEPNPATPTYLENVPGVGYALVKRVAQVQSDLK